MHRCVHTFTNLSVHVCVGADSSSNTWGVRLGQMLLAAKQQDSAAFYEKLKVVRKEQVVPLSAASYECGTYQRGYEYIVRWVDTSPATGSIGADTTSRDLC